MNTALLWIVGGFALIILEFFVTSFIVVFFGLAAVLVGIALWAGLPETSGIPYILFAALSLAMLFGLRARFQDWFVGDIASDNDSDDDFIGSEVEIVSGFDETSPGRGRVSYRGAQWDARSASQQLIKGSYARIISRHSAVLTIEPGN
jgi:membrane protein implicated in regulation of membrane protease activity